MAFSHDYEVKIQWQGNRKGTLSSPEVYTSIETATPIQFPKGVEGIWSPEHLFISSINSCFMLTFLSIAENSDLELSKYESTTIGKMEYLDGKFIISQVTIKPKLIIMDEEQKNKAERVLKKAESKCIISNSIRSALVVQPELIVNEVV